MGTLPDFKLDNCWDDAVPEEAEATEAEATESEATETPRSTKPLSQNTTTESTLIGDVQEVTANKDLEESREVTTDKVILLTSQPIKDATTSISAEETNTPISQP